MKRSREPKRYDKYLAAVILTKGVSNPNPFKALRTNGKFVYDYAHPDKASHPSHVQEVVTGDTLVSLAAKMGISKQALIRTEQGTYAEVPERILDYWVNERGLDYVTLTNGYAEFIQHQRKRNYKLFGEFPTLEDFYLYELHPFAYLRSLWTSPIEGDPPVGLMNITECAKLLCINQSVLDHFENSVVQQASVPKPLLEALRHNGYTFEELGIFSQAYIEYRDDMLGHDEIVHPSIREPSIRPEPKLTGLKLSKPTKAPPKLSLVDLLKEEVANEYG